MRRLGAFAFLSLLLGGSAPLWAQEHVTLTCDQLVIQGANAPFLYGAELQYFRARGGPGRNVPANQVHELWGKLLKRVSESKMNTVIFYIPWDFHEPEEGVFDFDGKLDRDGDGKPDYPSRNLKLFFRMLAAHGVKNIMVRPGPYINAEWGPTGFGAIPLWFLKKYPQALALRPSEVLAKTEAERIAEATKKPKVATFGHPIYREKAKAFFTQLHRQVLKDWIGPNKPVIFMQVDNETNYFWDSVYERDWNPVSLQRYRAYLRTKYGSSLEALNRTYQTRFASFEEVFPPKTKADPDALAVARHYDWYAFHDYDVNDYYDFIRQTWEELGVKQPDVLFTNCDSFNALDQGLLPRLDRQKGQRTLSTINVYPKTFGTQNDSTMNTPFKAAHDASLVAASHRQFYGTGDNWVMSTETVGGWFPPTQVSLATRQHTYGSMLGSGVKAMMVYYFHEGWNWSGLEGNDTELKFDAPLDKNMEPNPAFDPKTEPRTAFDLLKTMGANLSLGLGNSLLASRAVTAPILLAHDNTDQYPVPGGPDTLNVVSTDSAGMFGMLREAGYLPEMGYLDAMDDEALKRFHLIVWHYRGSPNPETQAKLERFAKNGGWLFLVGGPKPDRNTSPTTLYFEKNPAEGWNADSYAKMETAGEKLAALKVQIEKTGLAPIVKATTDDGKPLVHAWMRKPISQGSPLLFVENFGRTPRTVRVAINASSLPPAKSYRIVSRLSASATTRDEIISITLTGDGVLLPVSTDGVDVWEIIPQR